jgi:GNAT superfamily N-acetyltransferase
MANDEETSIVELSDCPEFIPTVIRWIRQEWPDSRDNRAIEERLCGSGKRNALPMALVAVYGGVPIGFVSVTLYEKGIEEGRPHWIDGLYVEPAYRGQGLASRLLEKAESMSAHLGITELFALTEIPGLYHKCGWRTVQDFATPTGRDFIVARRLAEKG